MTSVFLNLVDAASGLVVGGSDLGWGWGGAQSLCCWSEDGPMGAYAKRSPTSCLAGSQTFVLNRLPEAPKTLQSPTHSTDARHILVFVATLCPGRQFQEMNG